MWATRFKVVKQKNSKEQKSKLSGERLLELFSDFCFPASVKGVQQEGLFSASEHLSGTRQKKKQNPGFQKAELLIE